MLTALPARRLATTPHLTHRPIAQTVPCTWAMFNIAHCSSRRRRRLWRRWLRRGHRCHPYNAAGPDDAIGGTYTQYCTWKKGTATNIQHKKYRRLCGAYFPVACIQFETDMLRHRVTPHTHTQTHAQTREAPHIQGDTDLSGCSLQGGGLLFKGRRKESRTTYAPLGYVWPGIKL